MAATKWSPNLSASDKLDQLKLMYDYIKFHIQMYLATPAALALIADGFRVKQETPFAYGLGGMIFLYLIAGGHAGLFMSKHVNDPRQEDFLARFEQDAFAASRRFMHHMLYWIGLGAGLTGLVVAIFLKRASGAESRPRKSEHGLKWKGCSDGRG